jgi:hypothetical protein
MERFLTEYIERTKPLFSGIPDSTAHEIASAFLAFKFGLYSNAVRECTHALTLIPEGDAYSALKKALTIVKANAGNLDNSQFTTDSSIAFSEQELPFVAVRLTQDKIENPARLELDNALTLLYTVAINTSPEDEEALGEHRKYIIRLLTVYKKALGL